jgi:hypothetical protein
MSEKLDGRHEWPLLLEGIPGERSDDRADGVHLLKTDYEIEGEEIKVTAELIRNPRGDYWWLVNWERYDHNGRATWQPSGAVGIDVETVEQLTKLGAQS